jgi:3-hydroxyisobutyrate dehydrogenase-like beta-hydroxyacid dehydrogenase
VTFAKDPDRETVGVIGAGAMGMGVVRSLRRAGFATHVRDVRAEAEATAASLGAGIAASAAALARACRIAIVLVVDEAQVETVLFGNDGAAAAFGRRGLVVLSSTLDPDYVSALAPRLARHGVTLIDAPVSGGPQRAADGSMTMMVAGPSAAVAELEPVFAVIAAKVFRVGSAPGDAARFKIVNNLLAAANLAAGAEALALAVKAGLDLHKVVDVVNASSGGSWIFADRMPRALAGDFAPRAAAAILAKDVGIAADLAARLGVDAPFARAAREAFRALVDDGYGEIDDAAIVKRTLAR